MTPEQIASLKKITPGKWFVRAIPLGVKDKYFEVLSAERFPPEIAQTHVREVPEEKKWLEEDEANMESIAALPDLLAEREQMIEALRSFWAGVPDKLRESLESSEKELRNSSLALIAVLPEVLRKMQIVLAKAEGRS